MPRMGAVSTAWCCQLVYGAPEAAYAVPRLVGRRLASRDAAEATLVWYAASVLAGWAVKYCNAWATVCRSAGASVTAPTTVAGAAPAARAAISWPGVTAGWAASRSVRIGTHVARPAWVNSWTVAVTTAGRHHTCSVADASPAPNSASTFAAPVPQIRAKVAGVSTATMSSFTMAIVTAGRLIN